jgi:hypothetical protein
MGGLDRGGLNMSAATKFLVVLIAVLAVVPTQAAIAADATLYELSEEMTVDNEGYRRATSSFQGTAELGTPLCPQILATLLATGTKPLHVTSCTVTGVGSDKVDIATDQAGWPLRQTFGSGKLWGTFAVVVNADNVVDAPEYIVMTGTFTGNMFLTTPSDLKGKKQLAGGPGTQRIVMSGGVFTPTNVVGYAPDVLAAQFGVPVEALGLGPAAFSGVFRLPFAVELRGAKARPRRDRGDHYYLGDNERLIKVRKDEMALGYPTVRIEVNFGQ